MVDFILKKFGLPMGSPLSGVLARQFLEFLETSLFKFIIPQDSNIFLYIDYILSIYPWNNDNKNYG